MSQNSVQLNDIDKAAELAGGYVENLIGENDPYYDLHALSDYCKTKNILPSECTEEELRQFLVVKSE